MEKVTCELCGRNIDLRRAKKVPVLGYVGSTCYTRVNAMQKTLEKNGLGALADGPIYVRKDETVPITAKAEQVALKMGLELKFRIDSSGGLFWLEVRKGKRLRKALS